MKRDMNIIRQIFAEIQNRSTVNSQAIEITGVDPGVLARHIELLHDAQYIEAVKSAPLHGDPKFAVKDLTWQGHDFAAVLQNNSVWSKMKEKLSPSELATIPLSVLKTVGISVMEHYFKSKFGL